MKFSFILAGVTASFLLLLSAQGARATDAEFMGRLKNCKVIPSLVTRSQCYDNAIDDYDLETQKQTVSGATGKWKVTTEKSKLSDLQNVFLSLVGNDYYADKNGKFIRPSLVIRCFEGKTDAYAIWDTDLGKGTDPVINTRVEALPVVAGMAQRSGDNQSTFIPNAEDMTKQMIDQTTLFIKVWPSIGDALSTTFDIRGFTAAVKPLREACKW